MALLKLAWRNIWRHRRRSLITAVGMGIGVALSMAMIALVDGMNAQIFRVLVGQTMGHIQVHAEDYPARRQIYDTLSDIGGLMARIDGALRPAAASDRLLAYGLAAGEGTSAGARVVGIEPAREDGLSALASHVIEGSYLEGGPDEALIGYGLARTLKLGVGDELVLIVQAADGSMGSALYRVRGLVRTGGAEVDRAGVYIELAAAQELLALEDQAHEIVLSVDEPGQIPAAAEALRGLLGGGYLVQAWYEADPRTAQLLQASKYSGYIMLIVVFGVAGLGVLNTMLMAVFERTRELGLLRSLGLSPGQIRRLVLLEAALLGLLSVGCGLALGGLLDLYLVRVGMDLSTASGEGVDYQGVTLPPYIKGEVSPEGVLITAGFVLAVCVLAALWPAIRASRLRPVDAMREV